MEFEPDTPASLQQSDLVDADRRPGGGGTLSLQDGRDGSHRAADMNLLLDIPGENTTKLTTHMPTQQARATSHSVTINDTEQQEVEDWNATDDVSSSRNATNS